jgi:CheY-like chemotaxis protein
MRALLVDDDRELARLLTDYLATHGVAVDNVEDGVTALDRLATGIEAYDIVLLDVMLPGIDGFEVCRRIRARHDIPIVMLTARGEDTDRVVGLELGADDYVPSRSVLESSSPACGPSSGGLAPVRCTAAAIASKWATSSWKCRPTRRRSAARSCS